MRSGHTPPGIENPPTGPRSFDSGKESRPWNEGLVNYLCLLRQESQLASHPDIERYKAGTPAPKGSAFRPPQVDEYLKLREKIRQAESQPYIQVYLEWCKRLGIPENEFPLLNYRREDDRGRRKELPLFQNKEDLDQALVTLSAILRERGIGLEGVVWHLQKWGKSAAGYGYYVGVSIKEINRLSAYVNDNGDLAVKDGADLSPDEIWIVIYKVLEEKRQEESEK